ncbi:hypothetical protein MRX96_045186 [Rhipicephalus microplus]
MSEAASTVADDGLVFSLARSGVGRDHAAGGGSERRGRARFSSSLAPAPSTSAKSELRRKRNGLFSTTPLFARAHESVPDLRWRHGAATRIAASAHTLTQHVRESNQPHRRSSVRDSRCRPLRDRIERSIALPCVVLAPGAKRGNPFFWCARFLLRFRVVSVDFYRAASQTSRGALKTVVPIFESRVTLARNAHGVPFLLGHIAACSGGDQLVQKRATIGHKEPHGCALFRLSTPRVLRKRFHGQDASSSALRARTGKRLVDGRRPGIVRRFDKRGRSPFSPRAAS